MIQDYGSHFCENGSATTINRVRVLCLNGKHLKRCNMLRDDAKIIVAHATRFINETPDVFLSKFWIMMKLIIEHAEFLIFVISLLLKNFYALLWIWWSSSFLIQLNQVWNSFLITQMASTSTLKVFGTDMLYS